MDKQQIKKNILQAIKNDPDVKDIKSISLFGSYLTDRATENSDIDLLIEFLPSAKVGYFRLAHIRRNLESSVGKNVDLLTPEAISGVFRSEVLKQSETIYEK